MKGITEAEFNAQREYEDAVESRDGLQLRKDKWFRRLGIRPEKEPAEFLVDGLSLEEYLAELEDIRNQFETAFRNVGVEIRGQKAAAVYSKVFGKDSG